MKNNKSLGQHWLKDRAILDSIADLAMSDGVNHCVEIGPGLGTLTSSLLRRFKKVTAIEFDQHLALNLPKSFPGKNLIVKNADFLAFDLESLDEKYVVAGNIPYYITSPIIFKLISAKHKPQRIVLLIQKEVADRIVANVGDHTFLSLSVQNVANVYLGPVVKRGLFTPPPKVDSEVIVIEPLPHPRVPEKVFDIIKIGFSSPRKKLTANLSAGLHIPRDEIIDIFNANHINPDARPADLSLEDWAKLDISFHKR